MVLSLRSTTPMENRWVPSFGRSSPSPPSSPGYMPPWIHACLTALGLPPRTPVRPGYLATTRWPAAHHSQPAAHKEEWACSAQLGWAPDGQQFRGWAALNEYFPRFLFWKKASHCLLRGNSPGHSCFSHGKCNHQTRLTELNLGLTCTCAEWLNRVGIGWFRP